LYVTLGYEYTNHTPVFKSATVVYQTR
jgi:hypothetical protein